MAGILGIDPGSRVTGFGVIKHEASTTQYVSSGCIRATLKAPAAERLQEIFSGLQDLIFLHAGKAQVQHMVQVLLGLEGRPQEDAADALAIALCHVQTLDNLGRLGATSSRFRRGRLVESES